MPTTRQLILIRHSDVLQQPDVPANEWELSANGRSRCLHLIPYLRPCAPARIATSEETKARQTGQIIAGDLGVPVSAAPGLHEHDRRGVPYLDSREAFIAAVTDLFQHPEELVFGNETAVAARTRFETAVAAVMNHHSDDVIAIVSHGTVITLAINRFNAHIRPISFWRQMTLPAFYVLDWPGGQLQHTYLHSS